MLQFSHAPPGFELGLLNYTHEGPTQSFIVGGQGTSLVYQNKRKLGEWLSVSRREMLARSPPSKGVVFQFEAIDESAIHPTDTRLDTTASLQPTPLNADYLTWTNKWYVILLSSSSHVNQQTRQAPSPKPKQLP